MNLFVYFTKCLLFGAALGILCAKCVDYAMASDWPPGCVTLEDCQAEARKLCISGQSEWCIIIKGTPEEDEEDDEDDE